ncbi:4Fe-4S dicluster domain-containing protein [Dehalobacter sp. 4CP]|uniref:4Fe-4S dicluster domain-containing protein n=1 Tax=Dehalobacter sp. CP TaxID=2594474 RepID=UPI0039E8842E
MHIIAEKCIGCRQCLVVCPYEARWFQPQKPQGYYPQKGLSPKEKVDLTKFTKGKVTKCNFCMDKVHAGMNPVCVTTCPADARVFGDLDDPYSKAAKLLRERKLAS